MYETKSTTYVLTVTEKDFHNLRIAVQLRLDDAREWEDEDRVQTWQDLRTKLEEVWLKCGV